MKTNKGFTLIEVLIALLIISVGILGHAKMQMRSMDIAHQAGFVQIANIALIDLAHRMRANSDAASDFVESNLDTGSDIVAVANCSDIACTNTQFANAELAEWFDHLQNNLPSPRFSIVKSTDLYTITLIWDAAKVGVGSNTCDTSKADSYQCGSMEVWIPQ